MMVISSSRLRKGQVQFLRARKVVSDSLGLVDFLFRLENSVLNLPDGQEKPVEGTQVTEVLKDKRLHSRSIHVD